MACVTDETKTARSGTSMASQIAYDARGFNEAGAWRCVLGAILVLCAVVPSCQAQITSLEFKSWPTVITVTFDASRASAADVSRWMQLADYISNENGYQVPPLLEDCAPNDSRYISCE